MFFFKCALDVVPRNFITHDCGVMNLICKHCNAKHFASEISDNDKDEFTPCCGKEKFAIRGVTQNAFSGIASTLLIGGRTLHNAFKLPTQKIYLQRRLNFMSSLNKTQYKFIA